MPRQAHGRSLLRVSPSKPAKRKPQRSAALNALETAERQNPDLVKIRQHRLGEVEDDSDVPRTRADVDERSSKRRKVTNEREEGDDVEEGSDLEGGTWHTGVNDEDEDSDLDSDEAFGESDEEKFADFTFRGSKQTKTVPRASKQKKSKDINLDEDSELADTESDNLDKQDDEEDDLGEGAIDLATAWDLDDADQRKPNGQVGKKNSRNALSKQTSLSDSGNSDTVSEDEDSEDDSQDSESQFSVSEDELEGDTTGLRSFVEGLTTSKTEQRPKKLSDSNNLPSEPSRFGLPPSKLSTTDLLKYIKDPTQRQSLKILQSAERSGPEHYKGGIPGKLSAPLAKRQQDKLDRVAAYDKSKETLNRWIDTVKQNRRSEHLSFPLQDPTKESALGQKQLMPTSQSAPANDLEATITEIMQESGMGISKGQSIEDHEQAFEELAERQMDVEDVKARRAELRMARELMFREEVRARRIKKIKSKAYRRVHRRERDRVEAQQQEALAAAGLFNSDEEREKQDKRRAEERMGARHRESKWAKSIKQAGRAAWDEDARAGVTDLAKRDDELRRRIMGKDTADPDASFDENESESNYEADTDDEHQKFNEKLNALGSARSIASDSKLGQMAFMQRAEAARKIENDEEIRQLRLALDDNANGLDVSDKEYHEPVGRQKFGTRPEVKSAMKQKKPTNEFEARLSEDESEDDTLSADLSQLPTRPTVSVRSTHQKPSLTNVTIKQSANLLAPSGKQQRPKLAKTRPGKSREATEHAIDEYTSPSGSDADTEMPLNPDDAKAALAASIFAGPDDALQEFAKEKAKLVEEEGDQVIDNTLPGWGSWTGAGVSKRQQQKNKGRFITTIKGIAADKRQDAKLDRVIINEKRIKKNGRYLATELPHPFESRQQYERSLRLPVGPEWSTIKHYQDSIKPRVLLKQGTVIRPIARPIA